MSTPRTKPEQLSPYQEALLQRACSLYSKLNNLSGYEAEQFIFQELKSVTLESWKNGVEAGRRRATPSATPGKRS